MTDAQKQKRLKEILAEMEKVHADYLERFAKLEKKQMALYKRVSARAEAIGIEKLTKEIKQKKN
jgi:hypothetical protein